MEPGYFSREAVKDLLAVREGEAIYLRKCIDDLETANAKLRKQVDDLQSRLNVEQHYWKSI
jgi:hypothetical protein